MRRFALAAAKPRAQLWTNLLLGVVFLLQIPVALTSGLKDSVPYLVFLSLWALVIGHWSAALAAVAAMYADPDSLNLGECD